MSRDISKIPTEELNQMLAKQHGEIGEISTPELQRLLAQQQAAGFGGGLEALGLGGLRGLGETALGAGQVGTQLLATLAGLAPSVGPGLEQKMREAIPAFQQERARLREYISPQQFGAIAAHPSLTKLGAFLGAVAPAVAAPEAEIPELLGGESLAARAANLLARGAIKGAAISPVYQPDQPIPEAMAVGGLIGAPAELLGAGALGVGRGIGRGIGRLVRGTGGTQKILSMLRKGAEAGTNLTPEEAQEVMQTQYVTPTGEELPVDIGTLTNNETLKNWRNAAVGLPFSQAKKLIKQSGMKGFKSQIDNLTNEQSRTAALNDLTQKLEDTHGASQENLNNDINNYLNSLGASLKDRTKIRQSLANNILDQFENQKDIAKDLYAPFEKNTTRLDNLARTAGTNLLPTYRSQALDSLANRAGLIQTYGTGSDLGAKLNAELNKSENIIDQGNESPITIQEARQHMSNLGKLAQATTDRNQARILYELRNAMGTDLENHLRGSGNTALADQLNDANQHYTQNVIPYYNDLTMKKVIRKDLVDPKRLGEALLKNDTFLSHADDPTRNASLYSLITEGKGDAKGFSPLSMEEIGKKYGGYLSDLKSNINEVNPHAHNLFENIPTLLNRFEMNKQALGDTSKDLTKKDLDLAKRISDLKTQRHQFTVRGGVGEDIPLSTYITPHGVAMIPHVHLLSSIFRSPSKYVSKTLFSPELRQAYLTGRDLPTSHLLEQPTSLLGQILGINLPMQALLSRQQQR